MDFSAPRGGLSQIHNSRAVTKASLHLCGVKPDESYSSVRPLVDHEDNASQAVMDQIWPVVEELSRVSLLRPADQYVVIWLDGLKLGWCYGGHSTPEGACVVTEWEIQNNDNYPDHHQLSAYMNRVHDWVKDVLTASTQRAEMARQLEAQRREREEARQLQEEQWREVGGSLDRDRAAEAYAAQQMWDLDAHRRVSIDRGVGTIPTMDGRPLTGDRGELLPPLGGDGRDIAAVREWRSDNPYDSSRWGSVPAGQMNPFNNPIPSPLNREIPSPFNRDIPSPFNRR